MWEGEVWLYHSHIASALNLKLLNPREVVSAAEKAYQDGHVPLPAAEGFIRQILGWREYVRGIYWTQMPEYLERNQMQAHAPLPAFYWTGNTDMALLLGVDPKEVHAWYLGVYVDAVEWVELPNTLGMSQFADGGVMASKPYVASGKYIDRMSNHCKGCRFNPALATGDTACPFTTLYWDYLNRHVDVLAKNPRMLMQLKNLNRLSPEAREEIASQANMIKNSA
jgi:deoxyribodipyrimidine photolyase-related protein